jgi:arsenite methyltransferase
MADPIVNATDTRPAEPRDLERVAEIYNQGIADRVATFETEPREPRDLLRWLDGPGPFLVAVRDGLVIGFARVGAYSDRCVYEGVGEHAVYVARDARGSGAGAQLLSALAEAAERAGYYKLTSRVFTDNEPSLRAHERAGFERIGVQRRHGKLDGDWKDCVLLERLIGEAATVDCCSTSAQETCCEPEAKSDCCADTSDGSCGCSAGQEAGPELREVVRERYAAAAVAARSGAPACCGDAAPITADQRELFGAGLYGADEQDELPDAARLASLGCGNPTAVADLNPGETVLDLGSGGGIDVLLSARRVGPTGRAIGLDMTDEMLDLARANAAEAGVENVEFLKGYLEDMPLPDQSIDVIISNCVINLSGDKQQVLAEAARVLRPGGRFAVSDVIADPDMDEATRADMAAWTGCVAGALTREQFEQSLAVAGFEDVEINETHRVHEHASSAIIRARKP